MIAAIYARVSTDAQVEKGYSLQTQIEACRQKATELGAFEIIDFVDDGYSGAEIDRPAMNELREHLKEHKVNTVICYDPDRLSRNLAHQLIITEDIEKSRAQLIFVSVSFENSPEGKLFYNIRGAISAYEKEKIKERSIRGKRGKAKTGKIVFNSHPTGYDYDKETCLYVPNADADIVRKLYNMAISGMSVSSIACTLNRDGLPAPRGGYWHVKTILRILTNPLYYGQAIQFQYKRTKVDKKRITTIRDSSEWIIVSCPAIVTQEEYEKVQRQITQHKKFSPRNTKNDYILQNLLFCAKCGCIMRIYASGVKKLRYYRCSSTAREREFNIKINCTNRSVRTDFLDEYVWRMVEDLINDTNKIKKMINTGNQQKSYSKTLKQLHRREQELLAERDSIMKWFRQKLISEIKAEEQLSDIKTKLDNITQRIKEISVFEEQNISIEDKIVSFFNAIKNADTRRAACLAALSAVYFERTDEEYGCEASPQINLKLILR